MISYGESGIYGWNSIDAAAQYVIKASFGQKAKPGLNTNADHSTRGAKVRLIKNLAAVEGM